MPTVRVIPNKVLNLPFLIQHTTILTHNIYVCRSMHCPCSVCKSSPTALNVQQVVKSAVKEETSFCSISIPRSSKFCFNLGWWCWLPVINWSNSWQACVESYGFSYYWWRDERISLFQIDQIKIYKRIAASGSSQEAVRTDICLCRKQFNHTILHYDSKHTYQVFVSS